MAGYSGPPERQDTDVIGSRVGAQIIDLLLIGFISFITIFIFAGIGAAAGGSESAIAGLFTGIGLLIATAALVGYSFILEAIWDGQTIGKRILGIKVVQEDGETLDTVSALIRNLPGVAAYSWIAYLVALLSMAASDRRQRLFDRLAGTVVVREE
ncbi:MAG: RDD family protein [Candidatus Nanohaloarchaea archaeon]